MLAALTRANAREFWVSQGSSVELTVRFDCPERTLRWFPTPILKTVLLCAWLKAQRSIDKRCLRREIGIPSNSRPN